MDIEAIVILLVALLAAGTLLAARAGIRSIQRARTVVFYRTRRSHMLAGWQWLVLSLILFSTTVASALFGEPVANQFFSPALTPTVVLPSVTPVIERTLPPSLTSRSTQTEDSSQT